uniref:Uncharacterized protein n=1 Tax=candidate division WOR-3 bacterium TaxID=2052148 RepID=A0A7C4YFM2_UNCW3
MVLFFLFFNPFLKDIRTGNVIIREFTGHSQTTPLKMNVNSSKQIDILFVDDDGNGTSIEGFGYEHYWTEILNALGASYNVWSVADSGKPGYSVLSLYPIVIWNEPDYITSLSTDDVDTIRAYLDNGGKFWLNGEDVLYNLGTPPDWLPVTNFEDRGCDTAYGLGDTIGRSLVLPLDSISRMTNDPSNDWSDILQIDPTKADSSFYAHRWSWGNFYSGIVGLRDDDAGTGGTGPGKLFFLAMPFEALKGSDRIALLSSVLEYFGLTFQSYDVIAKSIIFPKKFSNADDSNSISLKITSVATGTVPDFWSKFIIKDKAGSTVYEESLLVSGLTQNKDTILNFPKWLTPSLDTFTCYGIVYLDNDGNHTNDTVSKSTVTLHLIAYDDFETGISQWSGTWEATDERSYEGTYSYTDSAYGNYPDLSTLAGTLNDTLNFTFFSDAVLRFRTMHFIEQGFDYGYLILKDVATGQKDTLAIFNADSTSWYTIERTLGNYTGDYVLSFELVTDPAFNEEGWYVDEFLIYGTDTDLSSPVVKLTPPNTYKDGIIGDYNVKVYTYDKFGIQAETLFYNVNDGLWLSLDPYQYLPDTFYFTIPSQPVGSKVNFYVKAVDVNLNVTTTPVYTYFSGLILSYDDGDADAYYIWGQGDRIASRFAPLGTNKYIEIKRIISYWYSDQNTPLDTVMFNFFLEKDTLPYEEAVMDTGIKFYPGEQLNASRPFGFTDKEMPENMKFSSPVYISAIKFTPGDYPVFGSDQSEPIDNNAYYYYMGKWYHFSGEDFMIRALVDTGSIHNDGALLSFISPFKFVKEDSTYIPQVRATLIGDTPLNCITVLEVDSGGTIIYADYDTTTINPAETLTISYAEWTAHSNDFDYLFKARIVSEEDEIPWNNSLTKTVHSGPPYGDFLVWDPDPNHISGEFIYTILHDTLGLKGYYEDGDTTAFKFYYPYLGSFKTVWVCLGQYNNWYTIKRSGTTWQYLKDYLVNKWGGLYLEGSRAWYWDPQYKQGYDFDTLFHTVSYAVGTTTNENVSGLPSTIMEGFSSQLFGQTTPDKIRGTATGATICMVKQNGDTVAHYYDNGDYRVFGSSILCGNLQDIYAMQDYITRVYNFISQATNIPENPYIADMIIKNTVFSKELEIELIIPSTTFVNISVYDITGKLIKTIKNDGMINGKNRIVWDGRDNYGKEIPSGVYFINSKIGYKNIQKKVIKVK